jgi:diketogulonate reductase-like aldo/keto reductase
VTKIFNFSKGLIEMRKTKRVPSKRSKRSKKRVTRKQKGGSDENNRKRFKELMNTIRNFKTAGVSQREILAGLSPQNKNLLLKAKKFRNAAVGAAPAAAAPVAAAAAAAAPSFANAGLAEMPQLCFGTVHANLEKTLPNALRLGYRHIDGADVYGGIPYLSAIKTALKESGIPRNQLWITWKSDVISPSNIQRVINQLECGYIDLFLVHHGCGSEDNMKVFQEAQAAKMIRYFGVSNCEDLVKLSRLREVYSIYANQIQARPPGGRVTGRSPMEPDFVEQCNRLGIRVMLFSTMSGVTNLIANLVDTNFDEYLRVDALTSPIRSLINKYYIQRYITPENHNVLMVGSVTGNPRNLQENLTDITTALSPDPANRRLLTDEQMTQTETILKSLTLSHQ